MGLWGIFEVSDWGLMLSISFLWIGCVLRWLGVLVICGLHKKIFITPFSTLGGGQKPDNWKFWYTNLKLETLALNLVTWNNFTKILNQNWEIFRPGRVESFSDQDKDSFPQFDLDVISNELKATIPLFCDSFITITLTNNWCRVGAISLPS